MLAVGATYPQALRELLDADAHETALINETFYRLGVQLWAHQPHSERRRDLATRLDQRQLTDMLALCCYFDRVSHRLTLGEAHFGLMPVPRRHMQAEALTLCCYGVEIRLVDEAGLWLCQRLRETLAPDFVAPSGPAAVAITYVVTAIIPPQIAEASAFLVTCDGVAVFSTAVEEQVYWWLRQDIDQVVARRSPQMLFAHAAVVGWRGVAIVIPGHERIGKSTLAAALVRRGATYYSDTFAVLDDQGQVHPYRGMIGLGVAGEPHNLRLVREGEPAEPLPVGLIIHGAYTPGAVWRPSVVRGAYAALALADAAVLAREVAARMQGIASQVAAGTVELRGPRSEASEVAGLLLDVVDDALVSRALDAAGDNLRGLADELARVAENRLRSPGGWVVSSARRLVAAHYVRKAGFLPPAEHRRLLEYLLSGTSGERHDEIWAMFERRLHAMLPFVQEQLEIGWYQRGRIEWQITAYGQDSAPTPRTDAGDPATSGRRISCIYYLSPQPQRFSGGELKLYDTWVTPAGSVGAGTSTTLQPLDNSLVFFPSDAWYELSPVVATTDPSATGCFAITIWFWAAATSGSMTADAPDAGAAGERSLRDDQAVGGRTALPSPERRGPAPGESHPRRLAAVVVPAHRFPLTADEQIAIRHLRTHLGEFDRFMIGPQAPPAEYADFARPQSPACSFADRASYNRLLVSEEFYQAFEAYEYVLIYQLDCLVFSNDLAAWCRKGYDYIGAPWFERWHHIRSEQPDYPEDIVEGFGTVGNGGFSLRKVDTALAVLRSTQHPLYDRLVQAVVAAPGVGLHEDIFWSFHAPKLLAGFRIPTPREALRFAFESEPRYCYRENGERLPFGCHAWPVYERDFWEPFLLQ